MAWSYFNPHLVYRVPLGLEALRARALDEATRLRDVFPTRSFRLGSARPLMLVPYTDGFDLLQFPQGSHPFGWLNVKVEPASSTCRLHVTRRRRPRPERAALLIVPLVLAVMLFAATRTHDPHAPLAVLPVLAVFALVMGFMVFSERRQERRLLDLLAAMFPGISEETPLELR